MGKRKYFGFSQKQIEALARENWDNPVVLIEVENELVCRSRSPARRLLGKVRERLVELGAGHTVEAGAARLSRAHYSGPRQSPSTDLSGAAWDTKGQGIGMEALSDDLLGKLLRICAAHKAPDEIGAVIEEAYIPFIPDGGRRPTWNGVLVLGEAQALGKGTAEFRRRLEDSTSRARLLRLYWEAERHVRPWDDGTLKLAMEAAFSVSEDRFAVSNAVLWSIVTPAGNNDQPTPAMMSKSRCVWGEMMPHLSPRCVVTTGQIAGEVVSSLRADFEAPWVHVPLTSASPRYLAKAARDADATGLLRKYPTVARVVAAHPEWVAKYRRNKIYFACEAVRAVHEALGGF